jgi:hypothetical protein
LPFIFFLYTDQTHTQPASYKSRERERDEGAGESCSLPLFFTDFVTEQGEGKFSLLLDMLYVEEENRERFERGRRLAC